MDYTELKKKALERYFSRANDMQREAIFRVNGPVLIIAGAGSGKTTVLCNRIANMTLFGDAYNSDDVHAISKDEQQFMEAYVNGDIAIDSDSTKKLSDIVAVRKITPWKILAVTFTNKAAGELKKRLAAMNAGAEDVWAFTFHSCCVRILRKNIESLGYKQNFTIYDSDDSLRVIKAVMKDLNFSDKAFNPKSVQAQISRAKDKLIGPDKFSTFDSAGNSDYVLTSIASIYAEYQRRLCSANALDFDDIIMKTVQLFENDTMALEYWQNHFPYIMVDEYQDTNIAQYKLIAMLAKKSGNLCVVGDEDQSIYRFRGATIENILSFEDEFKSLVVKLEQNYRSTTNILEAANAVISNNSQRKAKNLWSDLGEGDKIKIKIFPDEQHESTFIANEIMNGKANDKPFSDYAILYRNNAQSRMAELALARQAIPYRIIGGVRFYERKEVKDILAYMSVIENPYDNLRLKRVINEPKRQIGDATQAEIERISIGLGISAIEVMERADEFATLAKKAKTLQPFAAMLRDLSGTGDRDLSGLVDDILAQTGYATMLLCEGEEGEVRMQNINELKSAIITFCEENQEATLSDYLEQAALVSDMDNYDGDEDKVVLMTMHSAKGLEFDTVFIVGAEENIFPSYRSTANPLDLEEERRLAYVAITRAKRNLFITSAKLRLLYGQTMRNRLSRFINEIPEEYAETEDITLTMKRPERKPRQRPLGYLQSEAIERQKIESTASEHLTFNDGDRITHRIFGDGTVINATSMGGDTLLEIAFDRVGTKKIMANFAKIEKLS